MNTNDELELELKERYLIHYKASLFFRDSKYLNSPASEQEKKLADNNRFIRKSRYTFWVISVLELCKLFGKNESYSLGKLLNKLLYNHSNSEWKDQLSKDEINSLITRLESPEIKLIIKNIKGLRNQYYAHLDRSPNKTIDNYTPNYHDIEKLLDLNNEIISVINKKVFNTDIITENPGSGKADNILLSLSN